jgi:FAD linked oxidases, C-terminal domain
VPVIVKAMLPIAASEEFLGRAEEEAQREGWLAIGLAQPGVGVVEVGLAAEQWQMENGKWQMADVESAAPSLASKPETGTPSPETRTANPEPRITGLIARLRPIARDLGGSLVVTRCPAELKAEVDVWGPSGDDFEVMRKLKAAWDPKGTLSPGRFLGGI